MKEEMMYFSTHRKSNWSLWGKEFCLWRIYQNCEFIYLFIYVFIYL